MSGQGLKKIFHLNESQLPMVSWLVIAVLIGMVLISVGNLNSNSSPVAKERNSPELSQETLSQSASEIVHTERELEERLASILSQIQGAGKVAVSVFLSSGTAYEYAINVSTNKRAIDEKDRDGGSRITTENNVADELVLVRTNQTGSEQPVIIKEQRPKIQGVLVVAEGANDPKVRARLIRAVQTVLNLEAHRVNVLPKEGR